MKKPNDLKETMSYLGKISQKKNPLTSDRAREMVLKRHSKKSKKNKELYAQLAKNGLTARLKKLSTDTLETD